MDDTRVALRTSIAEATTPAQLLLAEAQFTAVEVHEDSER